jgi:putative ABC transport system substrate-binding protein
MHRRAATVALVVSPLAAALRAHAQPVRKARIAWISIERENPASPFFQEFRKGLRNAGWVEGRDLDLDAWWSDGVGAPLERTIAQAVARRPDVIVAAGGLVVRPLINANVTTPIVFTYSGDAVLGGVVESYARPGVNRTGISLFALEFVPKRLELMKEMLPGARRVAIVGWPRHAGEPNEREAALRTAGRLGFEHAFFPVSTRADLEAAFEQMVASRTDAILVFADGVSVSFAERFAAFGREKRIPAVSGWAVFAEKGNLMSYGPVLQDCYARLSVFVDRILKGAKPAELPVELPSTSELVINRGAAMELGVAIPAALLARADRLVG